MEIKINTDHDLRKDEIRCVAFFLRKSIVKHIKVYRDVYRPRLHNQWVVFRDNKICNKDGFDKWLKNIGVSSHDYYRKKFKEYQLYLTKLEKYKEDIHNFDSKIRIFDELVGLKGGERNGN